MSILIKNRQVVDDDFVRLADDAPVPQAGKIILSLARWQAENVALRGTGLTIGVRIPNTSDIDQIWPMLQGLPLIALEFPAFGDGRAYSQARLLRDRYHFRGEIRALGAAVVRDQLFGMDRCGITAFELRADQDLPTCLGAFNDFTHAYQGAADQLHPVSRQRLN